MHTGHSGAAWAPFVNVTLYRGARGHSKFGATFVGGKNNAVKQGA